MNNKNRLNVKTMTIAGLLTALAIIIPLFIPKLPVPQPFSVTPASHMPVILSMFFGPAVVLCTIIGSTIGFFLTLGPIVACRAFSHIIFALVGCYMLKKNYNIFLVVVVTMILHAAGEVLVVLMFGTTAFNILFGVTGGITCLHHCFDFAITMIIYKALKMANVFDGSINVRSLKA